MKDEDQERLLLEAYRLTELRLEAQAQFAVSSDQRSLVLAAVSVALAGFSSTYLASLGDKFWVAGSPLMFSVATLSAILSALPQKMRPKGQRFERLRGSIDKGDDFKSVIAGLALENDEAFAQNEKRAGVRSHFYKIAIVFFSLGVLFEIAAVLQKS